MCTCCSLPTDGSSCEQPAPFHVWARGPLFEVLLDTFTALFPRPEIKRILLSGTSLVVDRYAFSGVAFTAAKKVCSLLRECDFVPLTKLVKG